MKKNVGGIDKTLRIIIGIVLLGVGLLAPLGTAGRTVSLVIAAVALVTAFTGF